MSYGTKEVLSWPNSRDDTRFAAAPNKLKTRSLSVSNPSSLCLDKAETFSSPLFYSQGSCSICHPHKSHL